MFPSLKYLLQLDFRTLRSFGFRPILRTVLWLYFFYALSLKEQKILRLSPQISVLCVSPLIQSNGSVLLNTDDFQIHMYPGSLPLRIYSPG